MSDSNNQPACSHEWVYASCSLVSRESYFSAWEWQLRVECRKCKLNDNGGVFYAPVCRAHLNGMRMQEIIDHQAPREGLTNRYMWKIKYSCGHPGCAETETWDLIGGGDE